ncbi:MAG: adenylate kinase [Verrucomicrobiia bacterium]|jgi:adenylate kinase
MSHHRIVFLGPPASGKGTAAMALGAALGVPHVSTGQMFRAAIRKGGPIGGAAKQFIDKGQLVPDEIAIAVVRLVLDEQGSTGGFIFDGFPRTRTQAEAFDGVLQDRGMRLTVAILLDASEADILERVLGRQSCEKCGALYHKRFVPSRRSGVCDRCGGKLTQRADDTAETVRKRLEIYRQVTLDVVGHYERAGILKRVDSGQSKDKVFAEIVRLLQS